MNVAVERNKEYRTLFFRKPANVQTCSSSLSWVHTLLGFSLSCSSLAHNNVSLCWIFIAWELLSQIFGNVQKITIRDTSLDVWSHELKLQSINVSTKRSNNIQGGALQEESAIQAKVGSVHILKACLNHAYYIKKAERIKPGESENVKSFTKHHKLCSWKEKWLGMWSLGAHQLIKCLSLVVSGKATEPPPVPMFICVFPNHVNLD